MRTFVLLTIGLAGTLAIAPVLGLANGRAGDNREPAKVARGAAGGRYRHAHVPQSHDGILRAWTPRAYMVNVAPYIPGISYGNGWTHVDGWSERMVDYITAVEAETAA